MVARWISWRSTGDLLVLLIAMTICAVVLFSGATVAVLAIFRPDLDTGAVVGTISDVINTLIGLLAGFLAGRNDALKNRAGDSLTDVLDARRAKREDQD